MANRAYVSAWAKDYSEATQLEKLERLLETAPFSASWPGFSGLVVRALEPTAIADARMGLAQPADRRREIIEFNARTAGIRTWPMKFARNGICGFTI